MRRRLFSRGYEVFSRAEDRVIAGYRAETAGGARGRVLELGAGNGLNFARYREARVIALEPVADMLPKARARATEAPVPVHLVRGVAEALPFEEDAFDTVVVSLVMCSVPDPAGVAAEIRRVLKRGGQVRFFEHVRAHDPRVARRQDRIGPLYTRFTGGCRMNRDTLTVLRLAGFRIRYRRLYHGPKHLPHVIGVATPS
ncbi:MAG TPA: class I SAM-dependent methyltransferase [Actinomycetota bacterium]